MKLLGAIPGGMLPLKSAKERAALLFPEEFHVREAGLLDPLNWSSHGGCIKS